MTIVLHCTLIIFVPIYWYSISYSNYLVYMGNMNFDVTPYINVGKTYIHICVYYFVGFVKIWLIVNIFIQITWDFGQSVKNYTTLMTNWRRNFWKVSVWVINFWQLLYWGAVVEWQFFWLRLRYLGYLTRRTPIF